MKKLTLIRHAKSSWDDFSLADHDRPLNARGRRDAPFMAQMIAGRGWRPDLLVSSTALRAHTTAKEFAKALGLSTTDIRLEERIYEASLLQLQYLVQELDDTLTHVTLFGHNPGFGMLAISMQQAEGIGNLPTCGIVEVAIQISHWAEFDPVRARVEAFHYPKQYK